MVREATEAAQLNRYVGDQPSSEYHELRTRLSLREYRAARHQVVRLAGRLLQGGEDLSKEQHEARGTPITERSERHRLDGRDAQHRW